MKKKSLPLFVNISYKNALLKTLCMSNYLQYRTILFKSPPPTPPTLEKKNPVYISGTTVQSRTMAAH